MQELGRSRIFVVDDEPVIAMTLSEILKSAGFEAEAFIDPIEALRAAEKQCPDLIITDVMMPGLNGIDLGIQFKAMYPECRVLLFSGQSATSDLMQDARSKGHNFDLLAKPIHPKDLLAAIRSMASGDR